MPDFVFTYAVELARLIQERQVSAVEVLEAYLAHKRAEIARLAPLDVAAQCASYGLTY